jgi:signal transduction histidine kinase
MLRLRNDIFGALIPAFIALALGIVGFNYLMSGYFFRAFNKILDTMRTYKIGDKNELPNIETNTTEFVRMQNLFRSMIHRIENDYRHLKEYTENMAHEIQTPLTVIRNKIEHLIGDDSVMESHADSIKTIYSETNHLSKLGNTLNLLTKIENNEFRDVQEIQTKPLLEKHISSISELAGLKDLNIETDLNPDHTINLDPFLMDIVIKNLLRNAVSYGSNGGPIQVRTTEKSLQISNHGEPLDISEEKLFERFVSKSNNNDSLGLGLALVKKICDSNNLNISYHYAHGQHFFTIKGLNGSTI